MKVTYLCPALPGFLPPEVGDLDTDQLPRNGYLVEVCPGAGLDGPVSEGDVLVVDEARPVQHADLVVVDDDGSLRLCHSHRIGGRILLRPTAGPAESSFAQLGSCRGVVVRQASGSVMSEGLGGGQEMILLNRTVTK